MIEVLKDFGKLFAAEVLTELMEDEDEFVQRSAKLVFYGCGLEDEIENSNKLKPVKRESLRKHNAKKKNVRKKASRKKKTEE